MYINAFVFLYYLIKHWSLSKAISHIRKENKLDAKDVIETNILGKTISIFSNHHDVKNVLSADTNANLTFINETFMASHGHSLGIGALQSGTELWKKVHKNLADAIDVKRLDEIMQLNAHVLTHKYNFTYDNVNDVISEFVMRVWCQFCFDTDTDTDTDYKKYKYIRNKLIDTVRKTFYYRKTNYIPVLGKYFAQFYCWLYRKEFAEIDDKLEELINDSDKYNPKIGFIHEFKRLMAYCAEYDKTFMDKLVLDNAFLSVLVFDFLHVLMYNSIMAFAEKNICSYDERIKMESENIRNSFLFPYRIREVDGNYMIVNLIDSEFLFSSGPRSCIGRVFTTHFYKGFCKIFEHFDIVKTDSNLVKKSDNENIPLITSNHSLKLVMKKDKLKDLIQSFEHKGIKKFYRVESITENIDLYKYICHQMYQEIKDISISKHKKIDYLVISEARGFLFTAVSYISGIPAITVRKKGKIAGEVIGESYKKNYDDTETIEISIMSPIKDKNVILIDDGYASGETTKATHLLINKMGGTVCGVIVAIRHMYTKPTYEAEFDIKVREIFVL